MKKELNFPVIEGLGTIQKYLRSLLEQKKVSCYLCEEKVEMIEVLSPYIGLPKIIQQALFTDYFSGTNFVWDSGLYLEKHDKSFSGYIVRTREPKAGMGNTPFLFLLYDCVRAGVVKKDDINQLHLDKLPVLSMRNISGASEIIPVDWEDDMAEFFAAKEEAYLVMNIADALTAGAEGVEYAYIR